MQFAGKMAVVVRIRQSRISDQERVLDIWRNAADSTHHFLTSDDRRDIEIEVRDFLPQASLWLAVDDDDSPMGFMLLTGDHMKALFVDPSRHGWVLVVRLYSTH
jgi:putative acetyltransferase